MSEQHKAQPSNLQTILFIIYLSFVCALILSILASALAKPKILAKELDRTKQMMIAARILNHESNFLIKDKQGGYLPAIYKKAGVLIQAKIDEPASPEQILKVAKKRFKALLVDDKGDLTTFEKAGINEMDYLSEHKKEGFADLPLKLIYEILPNPKPGKNLEEEKAEGYVIPINGFGLWDAIYGYLAIEPNGDTVIGITWYDQKETPGLGGNIAEAGWQKQFAGKLIFQESPDGKTNFNTAPLGITVIKGKVSEVYGDTPKAKSAVDGMAGATLTGNGVTLAYKDSLDPYRPFLIKLHNASKEEQQP